MPTLKQLTCTLGSADSEKAFKEYYVSYEDGLVSCYCLLPFKWVIMSITLKSEGYIAPGLGMFIYIDGVYQANRSKRDLRLPGKGESMACAEIDFTLSQKEAVSPDGSIEATKWILYPLMDRSHEQSRANAEATNGWKQPSTVEIRVLRCEGDDYPEHWSTLGPPGAERSRARSRSRSRSRHENRRRRPSVAFKGTANQSGKNPFGNPAQKMATTGSKDLSAFDLQQLRYSLFQDSDPAPPNQKPLNWNSRNHRRVRTQLEDAYHVVDAQNPEKKHPHVNLNYQDHGYHHAVAHPKYIDTHEKPYARFVFRYRDKATLEVETGKPLDTSLEDAENEFADKTKEEVIAELVAQRKRFEKLASDPTRTVDDKFHNSYQHGRDNSRGHNNNTNNNPPQPDRWDNNNNNPQPDRWSSTGAKLQTAASQSLSAMLNPHSNLLPYASSSPDPAQWSISNPPPPGINHAIDALGPRPISPSSQWINIPGLSLEDMERRFDEDKVVRRTQLMWEIEFGKIRDQAMAVEKEKVRQEMEEKRDREKEEREKEEREKEKKGTVDGWGINIGGGGGGDMTGNQW